MPLLEEVAECIELRVLRDIPLAAALSYIQQTGCISRQIRRKRFEEQVWPQPFETPLELISVRLVELRCPLLEVIDPAESHALPQRLIIVGVVLKQFGRR